MLFDDLIIFFSTNNLLQGHEKVFCAGGDVIAVALSVYGGEKYLTGNSNVVSKKNKVSCRHAGM